MSSKRLTKQNMREDQFRSALSELYFGALEYMMDHSRKFAIGFGVVLLAIAGGIYAWQGYRAKGAESSFLLGQVMEAASAPIEAPGAKKENASQLTFATDLSKNQAIEARLATYQKAVGDSDPMGIYYKAVTQARAGKVSDAVQTVGPLTKEGALIPLALSLRASLFESQGQQEKAEADWKALSSVQNASWTPSDGLLALGAYYERRGLKEKAIATYSQVEKLAGQDADKNALAIRAKAKVGELKGQA